MDMIEKFHRKYELTEEGEVINRKTKRRLKIAANGYCSITVCGITTKVNVIKELAKLYIQNPNNYKYVICSDPQNPSIENIKWVEDRPTTINKKVIRIEDGKVYESMTKASKDNFVSRPNIYACCMGLIKSSGGYRWRFA